MAKSEAQARQSDVWVHLIEPGTNHWQLMLSTSPEPSQINDDARVIQQISAGHYAGVILSAPWQKLPFKKAGRPEMPGNLSFYRDPEHVLKILFHNVTGRFRFCVIGGAYYGYPACS